jgi:hypothetical protein
MVSESATYGTLILACATIILAIAYVIRRCQGIQFGTCCKLSVSQNPEPEHQTELPNVIIPVVNEIVRRISKDNNNPPPEDSNTQIV